MRSIKTKENEHNELYVYSTAWKVQRGGAVPNLARFDLDETASDEKQKSFHHTAVLLKLLPLSFLESY